MCRAKWLMAASRLFLRMFLVGASCAAFCSPASADTVAHWVADDLEAGMPAAGWLNRIEGFNSAIAPADQPMVVGGALNGHSVVRFDGTNDRFQVDAGAGNPMANANAFSLTVVFQTNTAGAGGAPNEWWRNSGLIGMELPGGVNDWGFMFNASGQVVAGMGGPDLGAPSSMTGLNNGLGHIATMTRQANELRLYVDGFLAASRSDVAGDARADQPFSIGSAQTFGGGGAHFTGNMAEAMIHNNALTSVEAIALATSLGATYDIPTFVPPPPPVPEILPAFPRHRYSFTSDASDSIGNADGSVVDPQDATAFAGGQLDLRTNNDLNSNQNPFTTGAYVDLPNGTISALGNKATFETWVTVETNRAWAEIFSFGKSDGPEGTAGGAGGSNYITLIPASGPGPLRLTHRANPGGGFTESFVDASGPLSTGVEHHIVSVWDEETDRQTLYLDGELIGSSAILNGISLATLIDINNWLGRSQFGDPLFDGQYNEFRIYDYALTQNQVLGNFVAGPDIVSAIPEPSSVLLAVAGLLPLAWLRRRRKA